MANLPGFGPGPEETGPLHNPSRWFVLFMDLPAHGEEHLLVETLRRLGARSVDRRGEQARALFPDPGRIVRFLEEVEAAVRASVPSAGPHLSPDLSLTWAWESHLDWSRRWRDAHPPRKVGRRFLVMNEEEVEGSQDEEEAESEGPRIPLILTPGVGFGTGEHATTRACLALLEDEVRPGDRIADVGSGSGILAVAAALLGAASVEAFEMDPAAAESARANIRANRVANRVRTHTLRVEVNTPLPETSFQGVMANLESRILLPLLPTLVGALSPGGWLMTSGTLASERSHLVQCVAALGLGLDIHSQEQGWWSAVFAPPRERGGSEGG